MKTIYLIKDLAQVTGLSTHTIKYYLKIGLICEFARSPGTNFRYFDDTVVTRLRHIRSYREQKKSLKEIKRLLETVPESRL
ncbi:MAG: MerR family transcriptional regulator [Candidatus Auribacterota bacterium]|nr:MerR family transcriptional regulator [Candidatus Auribacterota bacterium]